MQLYILGRHTDDKGSQLEQLTKRILESQGYGNVVTKGARGTDPIFFIILENKSELVKRIYVLNPLLDVI